jgi:hypothetical protein
MRTFLRMERWIADSPDQAGRAISRSSLQIVSAYAL